MYTPWQANAIYQAKQKLESIAWAEKRPVSAEELIRYAHRISSTNAVSAPLSWQQGDPRRPYPTGEHASVLPNDTHSTAPGWRMLSIPAHRQYRRLTSRRSSPSAPDWWTLCTPCHRPPYRDLPSPTYNTLLLQDLHMWGGGERSHLSGELFPSGLKKAGLN